MVGDCAESENDVKLESTPLVDFLRDPWGPKLEKDSENRRFRFSFCIPIPFSEFRAPVRGVSNREGKEAGVEGRERVRSELRDRAEALLEGGGVLRIDGRSKRELGVYVCEVMFDTAGVVGCRMEGGSLGVAKMRVAFVPSVLI